MGCFSRCASSNTRTTDRSRERVDQREEPCLHVVHERRLLVPLGDAEQQRQPVDDPVGVREGARALHEPAQLLLRDGGRGGAVDAGQLGDDGGDWCERRGVGVRARAAGEHEGLVAEPSDELVGQARLADAGFAEDRDEHRLAGRPRAVQALPQDRELARASDERDRASGRPHAEALDREAGERGVEALRDDVPPVAERDGRLGQRVGRLSDQDLAGQGGRLQPSGRVHDGAGDEELPGRPGAGRRLAGLDADADFERLRQAEGVAQPAQPPADRETCPHRAQGVVLVHGRQAEDRHHRVADELLRPPAERLELLGGRVEEPAEDLARALRVEALTQAGGVHEVGEEHRHHLALLGAERGRDERAAVRAEPGADGQELAADDAVHMYSRLHFISADASGSWNGQDTAGADAPRRSGPRGRYPRGRMARVLSTSEGTHRGAFTPADWLVFGSIGLIWGSSFLLISIGLEAFEPGLVTWLRVIGGAVALSLLPAARTPIDRADLPRLVAMSLLWVAIPFTLFPLAQQHVASAVAGMLNGGLPVVAAIIGSIMLRRLPTPVHLAGLVLGSAGVAAIAISAAGESSSEAIGVVMLLAAVVCYGVAINIAAPLQQRYGTVPVMARMLVFAAVFTAPFGIVSVPGSRFAWASLAAVAVLGVVGTGVAFALMGRLVGRVGGTRAAFATYLIPVVALILGTVLRDEAVATVGVVGIAMVLAGAALASRPDRAETSL